MNIGEAARASGISAKMIRHYEAIGLIAAGRGANHYRVYSQADVAELRFIRHARDLGFPLQDVKRLLDLWRNRARASAEVKRLALDHVAALEAKAKSLSAMAESLRHLADHCHGHIAFRDNHAGTHEPESACALIACERVLFFVLQRHHIQAVGVLKVHETGI